MSKFFLDTNIFVYALDSYDKQKQKKCQQLLYKCKDSKNTFAVSTQLVQEFFVVATSKLKIAPLEVKKACRVFDSFEVVEVNSDIIMKAIDIHILNEISFWDALIISAARFSNSSSIYTEDLTHNQIIEGVTVVNPFF